eukprot:6200435-Prymnesium_polylepis.1
MPGGAPRRARGLCPCLWRMACARGLCPWLVPVAPVACARAVRLWRVPVACACGLSPWPVSSAPVAVRDHMPATRHVSRAPR